MFIKSQNIYIKSEQYLLNIYSENKKLDKASRFIIYPYKHMQFGLRNIFKPIMLLTLLMLVLLFIVSMIFHEIDMAPENRGIIMTFLMVIPIGLVLFSVPSTYAFSGIKIDHIKTIVGFIQNEDINTIVCIELFEDNLREITAKINSRISSYMWLLGASWTVFIFYFSTQMRLFLSGNSEAGGFDLSKTMIYFSFIVLIAVITILLITGYKRASEIIIKTIRYSCTELKDKILNS